jgi:hypothetical protein
MGTARRYPESIEMRKQLSIRLDIKVDVAACLRAMAILIYLLN